MQGTVEDEVVTPRGRGRARGRLGGRATPRGGGRGVGARGAAIEVGSSEEEEGEVATPRGRARARGRLGGRATPRGGGRGVGARRTAIEAGLSEEEEGEAERTRRAADSMTPTPTSEREGDAPRRQSDGEIFSSDRKSDEGEDDMMKDIIDGADGGHGGGGRAEIDGEGDANARESDVLAVEEGNDERERQGQPATLPESSSRGWGILAGLERQRVALRDSINRVLEIPPLATTEGQRPKRKRDVEEGDAEEDGEEEDGEAKPKKWKGEQQR